MLPILFPLAHFFGQYGIASVQAVADVLSLILAIPISVYMLRKIKAAQQRSDTALPPEEGEPAS